MFLGTSDPSASYTAIRTDDKHDTSWSLQSYGTNNISYALQDIVWEQIMAPMCCQCCVDPSVSTSHMTESAFSSESLISDFDLLMEDEIVNGLHLSTASDLPSLPNPLAPHAEGPILPMSLERTEVLPGDGHTVDSFSPCATLNDFMQNFGVNLSPFSTSRKGTFGAQLLQDFGFAIENPSTLSASSTMSSTNQTLVLTGGTVDQDSRYERGLLGSPSSGVTPSGHSLVLRGKRKVSRVSHKILATTRAPSTRKAFSCSAMLAGAPEHLFEKICGWRGTDGSICGERVSRKTVPKHLVVHGITRMSYDVSVTCRWCPDGSAPMNRESIVRHFREVHLRLPRANTIV
ncbi:hypothetical protein BU15DRAFT_64938 [Melanogaster broomeanus]|nr:hypothetical protein BU15DRAFT_64938 [Melanogaster broomeanus]